jgi:hypothetical protein
MGLNKQRFKSQLTLYIQTYQCTRQEAVCKYPTATRQHPSNSCNRTDATPRLVPTSLAFHRLDLSTNPIFTQWQDQLLEQFFA